MKQILLALAASVALMGANAQTNSLNGSNPGLQIPSNGGSQLPNLNGSNPGPVILNNGANGKQLPNIKGSNPGLQIPSNGTGQLPNLNGSNPGPVILPEGLNDGVGPVEGGSAEPASAAAPMYPAPFGGGYNLVPFPLYGQGYQGYVYVVPVSSADFAQLVKLIKAQPFQSEQLNLIKAAGLSGWFTCGQCAALMHLFTFDDTRLQVLRLIAPHLIDIYGAHQILNSLTFDSSRQQAWTILNSTAPHS